MRYARRHTFQFLFAALAAWPVGQAQALPGYSGYTCEVCHSTPGNNTQGIRTGGTYSDGARWMSSLDGSNWIPAYTPYPNAVTQPNPQATAAKLMWHWDPATNAGAPDGTNGEAHAYFAFDFVLPDNPGLFRDGGLWVAADDYMSISLNDVFIGSYNLDGHLTPGKQPVAVFVPFIGLHGGLNRLMIEANDGYPGQPQDRGYEYIFVDSRPLSFGGVNLLIPEPSSLSLTVAALAGLAALRRRPHMPA